MEFMAILMGWGRKRLGPVGLRKVGIKLLGSESVRK